MAKRRHIKKKSIVKNAALSKKVPISNNINSEAIAAALSTTNQPVFLKVCRLCETKDGPFLNIFDIDKMIAKKIEDVMPFAVAENDDLPHKICFRCSAKVEELHEFIQKCVKTQISLRRAIGQNAHIPNKVKHRTLWEEKLNESNISNDDICDALIKKAMESIKEPLKVILPEEKTSSSSKVKEKEYVKEVKDSKFSNNTKPKTTSLKTDDIYGDDSDVPLKKIKLQMQKSDHSKSAGKLKCTLNEDNPKPVDETAKPNVVDSVILEEDEKEERETNAVGTSKPIASDAPSKAIEAPKPFDILDHVSMIKVNGVGILFQCKLCNRNFLRKEVVIAHGCAKNGSAKKIEAIKDPPKPPEPPKMLTVKYINTKGNGLNVKKEARNPLVVNEPINLDDDDEDDKPLKPQKCKPKIGPASKVKKPNVSLDETNQTKVGPDVSVAQFPDILNSNSTPQAPVVQFPTTPSTNSRYKLVPGPNNTFTLIEEGSANSANSSQNPINPSIPSTTEAIKNVKTLTKTKTLRKVDAIATAIPQADTVSKPYPVGLFQTVSHNPDPNIPPETPTFTTPAMKKQSYTVVQTGNPSKLLFSTKPQPPEQTAGRKKPRKGRQELRAEEPSKEPYSVTLEDAAPRRDSGFFTFINVDPLLQPSYVLPTDSIIQESQITTSTNAVLKSGAAQDSNLKYTCNMCNEKFSREKKLLTHIQCHYTKMDKEDQLRTGNNISPTRKRSRLSLRK